MDIPGLFAREAKRRATAISLLDQLDLPNQWQKFGTPYLVGAVSYDLVVASDIDIEVYCPDDPKIEEGFEVLRNCSLHPCVKQASFVNHIADEDQGYYWQLRLQDNEGGEWKVDMWSVRQDYPLPTSRDFVQPMRNALNDETRAAILSIKEAMLNQPVHKCLSIYVYQSVMRDGVRSFDEFLDWRKDHSEEGLVDWKPG
jgi:hypothetical protein